MVFKKVALYLRKSRFDDESETLEQVLERHEKILNDYCERNHLIIEKVYKEVVSGDSIEKRPEVQKLLEDVSEGLYDGVVVIEIERLSRGNPVDQFEILETFKEARAKIYTLQKVYDFSSDNDIDEEYFEFGLFMSRREYKTIKRRLTRGKKQAQREGYYTGSSAPLGYDRKRQGKGVVLIPNPEQAEIVRFLFNKTAYDNYTTSELHEYLYQNKIISPSGLNSWSLSSIRRIIRNKIYIGYIGIGTRTEVWKEWVKGKHEPLIDEKTFYLAQEKLNERDPRIRNGNLIKNPLAGILWCGYCNHIIYRFQDSKPKKNEYLTCRTRHCICSGIKQQTLETRLINELKEELKNFNYFLESDNNEIKNKKLAVTKEKELIEKEITKKEKMLERCCELLEEGIYTKEKYFDRVTTLENDINVLKVNLNELEKIDFDKEEKIKSSIPILEKVIDEYWNLDIKEKNKLLKSIIEKIEYKREPNKDFELKIYMKI
jgi:DNA invertase Pin-like site-specific DNA recombinase